MQASSEWQPQEQQCYRRQWMQPSSVRDVDAMSHGANNPAWPCCLWRATDISFLNFFFKWNRFFLAQIGPELSPCHQRWSWISDPPSSTSQILWLQTHATTSAIYGTEDFVLVRQIIYQLNCISALFNLDYSRRLWWPTKHPSSFLWNEAFTRLLIWVISLLYSAEDPAIH